jgi:hypothetical protein
MAGESIFLNPTAPLKDVLSDLPSGFKAFLKNGFSILAGLSTKEKITDVVYVVLEEESPGRITRSVAKDISERLGIPTDDVSPLFTTATFCITIFIQQKTLTADEFIVAAGEIGIINEKDRVALHPFIDFVAESRSVASDVTDKNQLVARLLPALTRFSTIIDIRPSFGDDEVEKGVKFSVPVVLARIETDSTENELCFQMSKRQLQRLIGDLQQAFRRVEIAEKWSAGNTGQK